MTNLIVDRWTCTPQFSEPVAPFQALLSHLVTTMFAPIGIKYKVTVAIHDGN